MNTIPCNTILIHILLSILVLGNSISIKQLEKKHSNPHSLNHNQNGARKSFLQTNKYPSSVDAEGNLKFVI